MWGAVAPSFQFSRSGVEPGSLASSLYCWLAGTVGAPPRAIAEGYLEVWGLDLGLSYTVTWGADSSSLSPQSMSGVWRGMESEVMGEKVRPPRRSGWESWRGLCESMQPGA